MPDGKKLTRFSGSVVRIVRKCFAIGSVIILGNLFAVDALRGVDEVCGYRRVLLIIGTHEAHPRAMSGVSAPDALKANAAVVKARVTVMVQRPKKSQRTATAPRALSRPSNTGHCFVGGLQRNVASMKPHFVKDVALGLRCPGHDPSVADLQSRESSLEPVFDGVQFLEFFQPQGSNQVGFAAGGCAPP